ncbi:MAG: ankyrin repeat domain-containing protein [Planctomycetota bacterium]|nr:MAG: ankyrin repeat domain-containing protein [Planctomycetota bacterium]
MQNQNTEAVHVLSKNAGGRISQMTALLLMLSSLTILILSHYFRHMIIILGVLYFYLGSLSMIFISIGEQCKFAKNKPIRNTVMPTFIYLFMSFTILMIAAFLMGFVDFEFVGIVVGFLLAVGWGLAVLSVTYIPLKQRNSFEDRRIGKNRLAGFIIMFFMFTLLSVLSFTPFIFKILVIVCFVLGVYSVVLFILARGPWLALTFAWILTVIFASILFYTWYENRQKALFIAILNGDVPKIKYLISEGYDVNATDRSLGTTLHAAIECGDRVLGGPYAYTKMYGKTMEEREQKILEMLELLTDNGVNINAFDTQNNTPLALAAMKSTERVVEWFIENGAEVNTKNKQGDTPLKLAIMKGHKETAEFLRKHGAKE